MGITKFKFFPWKRNGELAKTPIYFDTIDKESCLSILGASYQDRVYRYSHKSLYNIYLELLDPKTELDIELFLNKYQITTEEFLKCVAEKVREFRECVINLNIARIKGEMRNLEVTHTTSIQKLEYVAFRMPRLIEKYKILKKQLEALENNEIVYWTTDDENFQTCEKVIEDITPIDIQELS